MAQGRLRPEISGCEIFASLEPFERERLAALFIPRSFEKDEIIFLKGDPAFGLYMISRGKVKISVTDRYGAELIFTFLSIGDLLGEMAILDGKPRSATAVAVEDTGAFYLDRRDFLAFLHTSPQACIGIISVLCQRLRRVSSQLEELSFLDVSGRIARKLLEMAPNIPSPAESSRLTFMMSQEDLARVIGASRVMVNKVLNSFVDMGLVSIARKRLTVLNFSGLNRIASYEGDT